MHCMYSYEIIVTETMIEDKRLDKWKSESAFRFHSKIPSENILQYLSSCSESSTDVTIYCSDGTVAAHKLVLASLSKMLCLEFQENIWDDIISITMPDFTVMEVSRYLADILQSCDLKDHPQLNFVIGYGNQKDIPVYTDDGVKVEHESDSDKDDLDLFNECDQELSEDLDDIDYVVDEAVKKPKASATVKVGVKDTTKQTGIKKEVKASVYDVGQKRSNNLNKKSASCWKYFEEVDPTNSGRRLCQICKESVPAGKSSRTGNMLTHLRSKHGLFVKERKKEGKYWIYFKDDPTDPSKALCQLCETPKKIFAQSQNLNRHLSTQHQLFLVDNRTQTFVCSFCGKSFSEKWNRDYHETCVHKKIHQYHCDDCGKGFFKKQQLDDHMREHTGERPYQCSRCGKGFISATSLKTHEKVHVKMDEMNVSDTGPFPCKICGKTFDKIGGLKIHQSFACGAKNLFECTECGKTLNSKLRLDQHMRVHTGEKPFQCSTCGKKFKFKHRLNYHKCLPSVDQLN